MRKDLKKILEQEVLELEKKKNDLELLFITDFGLGKIIENMKKRINGDWN